MGWVGLIGRLRSAWGSRKALADQLANQHNEPALPLPRQVLPADTLLSRTAHGTGPSTGPARARPPDQAAALQERHTLSLLSENPPQKCWLKITSQGQRNGPAPGHAPGPGQPPLAVVPPGLGESAGGPTWGDRHDPGFAPAGPIRVCHCPPHRLRPQDRAQVYRAGPRGAGLRATAAAPAELAPFDDYLRERVGAFPELTGQPPAAGAPRARLHRRLHHASTTSCASSGPPSGRRSRCASRRRPASRPRSTSPTSGRLSPTSRARAGSSGCSRLVLGHSRCSGPASSLHQDLQTLLRCHAAAFEALGGVPAEILYDRMRTVVIGEDDEGGNRLQPHPADFARHYGFLPKACRPYRAKTKGKVERPFRYIREDFFLGRSFRNLDDLNTQLARLARQVANVRVTPPLAAWSPSTSPPSSPTLQALPAGPFQAVLRLERRDHPRRHGLGRRQSLQRAGLAPDSRPVEVHSHSPTRCRSSRTGRVDRRPSRPRGPRPAPHRRRAPQRAASRQQPHAPAGPPPIRCRRSRRAPAAGLLRRRRPRLAADGAAP